MEYRKDIQILRAIAVLLVVLFHLEITGFSSGYLGVDIFFVISGYLMSRLYQPSAPLTFFRKRATRLLPAYFIVVVVTIIVSLTRTTPNDFDQVKNQALFGTFFISNVGFWLENSYFDKAAFKPLLHLWSLGVEIQFYLLVPAIYFIFKKNKFFAFAVILISALLCFKIVAISPKTSFFWLPLRLWEFLLGFAVDQYLLNKNTEARITLKKWLSFPAMAAILLLPLAPSDGNANSFLHGHPGASALLISLSTAALLFSGIPTLLQKNPIATALEKIGEYSYSIYLVHFPVIVLLLYRPFAGTITRPQTGIELILLILVIVALSAFLHFAIERPLRWNKRANQFSLANAFVVCLLCILGTRVQEALTPSNEMLVYQAWLDRSEYRCGKTIRILHPTAISCEITPPLAQPEHRVLLVGNSHADSIKTTFASVAYEKKSSVFFIVENNPLMPGGLNAEQLIAEAEAKKIDSIILHYTPAGVDYEIVRRLNESANKRSIKIAFVLPVPIWDTHIPTSIYRNMTENFPLPSQTANQYNEFNAGFVEKLSSLKAQHLKSYPVVDTFCKEVCAFISESGRPLYFDNGHLTLTGSEMLRPVFNRLFDELS
jgi:peptidoglycan/LPS O-acetylase OafA/YrhL